MSRTNRLCSRTVFLSIVTFSCVLVTYAAPVPKELKKNPADACYRAADMCQRAVWKDFTTCISKNGKPSDSQVTCVYYHFEPIYSLWGTASFDDRIDFFDALHEGEIAASVETCLTCIRPASEQPAETHDTLTLDDPLVSICLIPFGASSVPEKLNACQWEKISCLKTTKGAWEKATLKDKEWFESQSEEDKKKHLGDEIGPISSTISNSSEIEAG